VGQAVSDRTLEELAQEFQNFEPPLFPAVERVVLGSNLEVLVASVARSARVTSFRGVAYERVLNTTRVMSRETYQRLLLEEKHATVRWENQPAMGVALDDLDKEEILRTRQMAIDQRRLSAGTGMDVGDILDRLGLRVEGQVTNAAQMLYGTKFLPYYPQALIKLGRFRGTQITGDILDNKQEHLHAFGAVREAVAWLDRTLPLAAHFPKGSIFRQDRLPVPAEALRETIVNAVIHRDYSLPFGHVAIAVFDDRIEVRSVGEFPAGIDAAMLSREHPSVQRNPLMAGAFHRTGAVEVWGRGTNRVIEACEAYGVPPPQYAQAAGVVTVTFRLTANLAESSGTKSVPSQDQAGHHVGTKLALSRHQVQILELARLPKGLPELMDTTGRSDRTKFREQVLRPLLDAGLLEMTIPDKPRSPNQQYRTTAAGVERIGEELH
jgi:ATP-dependent DNA helicase RecG